MRHLVPATATLTGADGNRLVGDIFGEHGPPVLLLHGGGQTRHAWRNTAERIARSGMTAYAVDQRGHGDSDWAGAYSFFDYAADVRAMAEALTHKAGRPPIVIGASLGGIATLLAEGEAEREGRAPLFAAIVLVDITPRVDVEGVEKIRGFMKAHAREGFATVEDAAEAVAAYLPHRERPRSLEGLKKNLRLHSDGRWRWHWDPRFIEERSASGPEHEMLEKAMVAAARGIKIPALLVRGGSSELVREAHAREFLELVPHAEYVDVTGARHMVAGDRNDQFATAILGFVERNRADEAPSGPAATPS